MLFTLDTDDCRKERPNQYILSTLTTSLSLSLLSNSNCPEIHHQGVHKMVEWSDLNALKINAKKTEEIVFGSPSESHRTPILIHNETISSFFYLAVSSYNYLGAEGNP